MQHEPSNSRPSPARPPQTVASIKDLLAAQGFSPRKAFGQNFLIDQNMLRKLIEASGVRECDRVVEVGPGTGVLTDALLDAGARVVACEIDRGLAALLRERYAGDDRFTLLEGDAMPRLALRGDLLELLGAGPFRLIANLPYNIASPLMLTLLVEHPGCFTQTVTIQREVAQRLLARPNSEDYGGMSILAQSLASVTRVADLPPSCFWPQPSITSSVVHIARRETPLTDDPRGLAACCTLLFSQRRRQIASILARRAAALGVNVPALPEWLDPSSRAETLTPQQMVDLSEALGPLLSREYDGMQ